jgi:hypothetical protein
VNRNKERGDAPVRTKGPGERMTALGRRLAALVGSAAPDVRDLHVYGGGGLIALAAWLSPWSWVAPAAFGALLLYLGLRRV